MNSLITSYFPSLTLKQAGQFDSLKSIYTFWNSKINVISRKDMDNFYERHVLHSLGIAKVMDFAPGTSVLDAGTGGGFPGIPLAVMFPYTEFVLVDSVGKKIKVVEAVVKELNLTNVKPLNTRVESMKQSFHFVVSRAVTTLPEFIFWTRNRISGNSFNTLGNGILYLKGGDLTEELSAIRAAYTLFNLNDYFLEPFFETKKVVHIEKS